MKKVYLFCLLLCFNTLLRGQATLNKPAAVFTGHADDVGSLAYSPYAKLLASGSWDNAVNLYTDEGKLQKSLKRHTAAVEALTYSRDGKYLFSGSNDFTAMQFDATSGSAINIFVGHTANITALAVDAAGKYLFSGSDDGTIKLWDLSAGGTLFKTFPIGSSVHSIALANDGKTFFVACNSKDIIQYDMTGKEVKRYTGHKDFVNSVALSLNGKYMVSGSNDKSVMVWDLKSGKLYKELIGHALKVNVVQFSFDNKYIISGSNDGTARIWNTETGDLLYILNDNQDNKIRTLAITFDKKFIYTGGKVKDQKSYGVRAWKVPFDTLEKKAATTIIGQGSKEDKNNGLTDPNAKPQAPLNKTSAPANSPTGSSNPKPASGPKPAVNANKPVTLDSTKMTLVPDTEAMRRAGRPVPTDDTKKVQPNVKPAPVKGNEKPAETVPAKPAPPKNLPKTATNAAPPQNPQNMNKVDRIKMEQQQLEQKEKEKLEKQQKEKADSTEENEPSSEEKPKSKFRKLK